MVTKVVLYGLMFAAVGGLIWANKQFKGKGAIWARPLSIVLGVFAVVLAVIAGYLQVNPTADKGLIDEFKTKESAYQTIAAKKFGELIAKNHSSAKAVVIKAKYGMGGEADYINQAVMDGLKAGLGGNVELFTEEKVFEGTLPEMEMGPDGMPPEIDEELYSAKIIDEIIKTNKDCKVIISFCGLPNDLADIQFWRTKDKEQRPAVYLYNGNIYELKLAIKAGLIGGVLIDKPIAFDIRSDLPSDEQAAFDSRFLLITAENVDAVAAQYPLFAKEKKKK